MPINDSYTIFIFKGSKNSWHVRTLYDATELNKQAIQEIETGSKQMVETFKEQAFVYDRKSAQIYRNRPMGKMDVVNGRYRDIHVENASLTSVPGNEHFDQYPRFLEHMRTKLLSTLKTRNWD